MFRVWAFSGILAQVDLNTDVFSVSKSLIPDVHIEGCTDFLLRPNRIKLGSQPNRTESTE